MGVHGEHYKHTYMYIHTFREKFRGVPAEEELGCPGRMEEQVKPAMKPQEEKQEQDQGEVLPVRCLTLYLFQREAKKLKI